MGKPVRTILFICSGNTCRSPMAEAIAQDMLGTAAEDLGVPTIAASAGIAAFDGMPPSPAAVMALHGLGIEYHGHSLAVTVPMITEAEKVWCMTESICTSVRHLVATVAPPSDGKIEPLDPGGDIEDPIGMEQEAYDALALRFQRILSTKLREFLADEDSPGI